MIPSNNTEKRTSPCFITLISMTLPHLQEARSTKTKTGNQENDFSMKLTDLRVQ